MRSRFAQYLQLRLSTVIILVLLAGVMMGLNLRPMYIHHFSFISKNNEHITFAAAIPSHGWPFPVLFERDYVETELGPLSFLYYPGEIHRTCVAVNFFICCTLLILAAFLIEHYSKRRARLSAGDV
ncbi:MAG TPA: hypothetical protein VEK08_22920 [Planctomycetota bacterium]|nr:hypothetical protein [Planctomycetota bacterium]